MPIFKLGYLFSYWRFLRILIYYGYLNLILGNNSPWFSHTFECLLSSGINKVVYTVNIPAMRKSVFFLGQRTYCLLSRIIKIFPMGKGWGHWLAATIEDWDFLSSEILTCHANSLPAQNHWTFLHQIVGLGEGRGTNKNIKFILWQVNLLALKLIKISDLLQFSTLHYVIF